jgi:hypothetical protein
VPAAPVRAVRGMKGVEKQGMEVNQRPSSCERLQGIFTILPRSHGGILSVTLSADVAPGVRR